MKKPTFAVEDSAIAILCCVVLCCVVLFWDLPFWGFPILAQAANASEALKEALAAHQAEATSASAALSEALEAHKAVFAAHQVDAILGKYHKTQVK